MKSKISLVNMLAIIGFMAIVVLASCQQQPKEVVNKEVKVSEQQTIMYVNSDSLLSKYEYFKDIKAKFEAKSKQAEEDLKSKGTAFQREVASYQQAANTMTADQRAATEQRLARKQQELQGYQQNAGAALQNEEGAENEKLYNRVADYLKKHAKDKGYKMVLTYSKNNSAVLFADESLDITSDVLKGLNEEYKSSK